MYYTLISRVYNEESKTFTCKDKETISKEKHAFYGKTEWNACKT